ncbi:BamA/TamA family outer membrane protein [Salinibacter grassmerensis]|uniref:BamA/TamA family outer membrane protein n=1 Tax=Salinibacter grassmerensis TaxID=3040353 RepID=UPI0021E9AE42|nr:BamA/TamA family outer membrane protein [Salinibacter grassmerensis]
MTPRHVLCVLLLCGAVGLPAQAQSFSTVTGRNHPEIDWRVATTEHFEIVHPARLDRIAAEAAPIAETTYDTLSANLDVTFDERIRVYLSDQDAIVNGFAVPFGTGYTDIWVNTNDWAASFSGATSWLRLVLAHELTHIFHYKVVRSGLGVWALALGGSFPRVWTEGLAQYQAETWNAQRGERWLRAAVLDDALSYNDGRSLRNGRLLYASGHSQVRYFAQQHGDSTLTALLHHKKDVLFGLAEAHDLDDAFRATVGQSYETFHEQWRRDVNVYYNTLAGQLETLDSLRTDTLAVPGQYVDDLAYSPDTSRIAALTQLSPERPVRRLHVIDRSSGRVEVVAEGAIEPSVAWHPSGERIAFSRQTRAEHGSLVDDLFVVDADGTDERRLTHGRRTSAPTYGPDGERLAFVATQDGTANVHVRTDATGRTTPVTDYEGDVQITAARWHPSRDTLALARVDDDGGRQLVLHDLGTEALTPLTDPGSDDRRPVWSPDGAHLAYTSLRDGVPNAFVYDAATDTHRRATHLVRGATVHDWVPADSAFGPETSRSGGALVTATALTKARDGAFRVPASRTARSAAPSVPEAYAAWTATKPPRTIPRAMAPDPSLIEARSDYDALGHVAHRASVALPYYTPSNGDIGLSGVTSWTEPLGAHTLNAVGSLSLTQTGTRSEVVASYLNRQFEPTVGLTVFSASSSARIYGSNLLVEDRTGGDLTARWPLDWRVRPYVSTSVSARLRYADLDPLTPNVFAALPDGLAPPQAGQQASLRLQFTRRKRPPYRHTLVHPLDGWGLRLRATGAAEVLGGDSSFLRGDVAGYAVYPSIGNHRLYLHGRLQAQTGASFPQDYVGFSRYDAIDLPLPGAVPFSLGDAERVRGFRQYVLGNRVAFGRAEYRVPVAPSLQTEVLGLVGLGYTTLSAFVDGGMVWRDTDLRGGTRQLGTGVEVKNALRLFGVRIGHALGVAQPAAQVGTRDDVQLYYRVQTALPF